MFVLYVLQIGFALLTTLKFKGVKRANPICKKSFGWFFFFKNCLPQLVDLFAPDCLSDVPTMIWCI